MTPTEDMAPQHLLTLPESPAGVLSIRAKALLFHDPRSVDLLEQVERIARSDASVLVIGETGTGKELIARHLHARSGRKGPFLAVNCGAFSESLIDAELFGHEAGAFTGASQARAGWFEAANGGTLFLDEIGDLPLALQVKLLRVLQERQVVRLGSRKTIALDVRLVAATNIDLRRAVEAQHFRADLYYRLSVAPVQLPPLRERPGDILPLARHFLSQYAPRLGLDSVTLADDAQQALLSYCWPGNIRELENVIHFGLIVCRNGEIRAADLRLVAAASGTGQQGWSEGASAPSSPATRHSDTDVHHGASFEPIANVSQAHDLAPLQDALERLVANPPQHLYQTIEDALVRAAFARVGANQVKAARLLGVTRNTLRTLLKRHGLLTDAPTASLNGLDMGLPLTH